MSFTVTNFDDGGDLVLSVMELLKHLAQDSEKLKEEIQWELERLWAQLLPTLPTTQQGKPDDQQQCV